jgi:hypothetical protein
VKLHQHSCDRWLINNKNESRLTENMQCAC